MSYVVHMFLPPAVYGSSRYVVPRIASDPWYALNRILLQAFKIENLEQYFKSAELRK